MKCNNDARISRRLARRPLKGRQRGGRAVCSRPTLDCGFGSDNAERELGISCWNVYDDKIQ